MSQDHAPTPKNPWGIKVPVARFGAAQLPIPQPATVGESRSEQFRAKLKGAVEAQISANTAAHAARRAIEDAKPFASGAEHAALPAKPAAAPPATAQTQPAPTASAHPAPDGGRYIPAGASWPSPADALAASKAEPQGYRWPSASGLDGAPTMADRARTRYGLPPAEADERPAGSPQSYGFIPAAQALAAAAPAPTFSDAEVAAGSAQSVARMRARYGLPNATVSAPQVAEASAPTPSPGAAPEQSLIERMAARHGVSLDAARREPEPAPAALLLSRSDR